VVPSKPPKQFVPPRVSFRGQEEAVNRARDQIMAAEDQRVFDALDRIAQECRTEGHPGFGKPMAECDHPDCVTEHVHES
jgi:hypothetical protein